MAGPAVIVRDAGDVRRALARAASGPFTLITAPGAAAYAGPAFLQAMLAPAASRADMMLVIDCGADPGIALRALQVGWRHILLDGPLAPKVASAAERMGATVHARGEFPVPPPAI